MESENAVKTKLKPIIPYLGLIAVFLLFAFTTEGRFATISNMQLIITQSAITMVGAIGCTFVMAHNNLDFSLGGAMAMCAVVAFLVCEKIGFQWLLVVCAIVGICCGLVTAVLHIKAKIPAFMAGLCIMFAGKGIAQTAYASKQMFLPVSVTSLSKLPFYLGIVVVLFLAGAYLFNYTVIGKYNRLIGSNPRTAKLSGISIGKYKAIAFGISGFCVGVAAFMTMVRTGGVTGSTGTNFETEVLLSLTLGGIPLTGGSNTKIRSAVIGTLIYYFLNNGLVLWGVNANMVSIIKAVIFLAAVVVTIDRGRNEIVI
ncbi:MAG: ABC transporter permease [Clostridiales bacterium]|nr:ABC transporter permease [Clostridiales bacterium]